MDIPAVSEILAQADGRIARGDYFGGTADGTSSGRLHRPSRASDFGQ